MKQTLAMDLNIQLNQAGDLIRDLCDSLEEIVRSLLVFRSSKRRGLPIFSIYLVLLVLVSPPLLSISGLKTELKRRNQV